VRGLVVLGRAARGHAKLKVRQPLPAVLLVTKSRALRERPELLEILADELNVKAVRFVDDPSRYVTFEVKPRFDVLGPKYGPAVQAIARAVRTLDPVQVLRAFDADGRLTLSVDGQEVVLSRDDVEARMHEARGYAAEGAGGEFAVLETDLTPALLQEGQAREVVHQVQTLRKDADLAVDDRIVLHYEGPLDPLLAAHRDYIMRETLAVELRAGLPAGAPARDIRLDGVNIRLSIARRQA
jgi:isoleucyl-tRNA synthetase